MAIKIEALETLARELVGDGKTPNLFFVTDGGVVVGVSRDFDSSYAHWQTLAARNPARESALEDRLTGCLASVEPDEDGSTKLVRIDDTESFDYR